MFSFRKHIGLQFSCVVFVRFSHQSVSGHIRMNWEVVLVINLLHFNSTSISVCLLCEREMVIYLAFLRHVKFCQQRVLQEH